MRWRPNPHTPRPASAAPPPPQNLCGQTALPREGSRVYTVSLGQFPFFFPHHTKLEEDSLLPTACGELEFSALPIYDSGKRPGR